MTKEIKKILVGFVFLMMAFVIAFILKPGVIPFLAMQANSIAHAGTWEDDPQNWHRAFKEKQPAEVKVVHSKYWRSNHFTYEFTYYFEVEATPEWRDAFLRKRDVTLVPAASATSFRSNNRSDDTPAWFAPDPIDGYDMWDKAGTSRSVWINKTNGHIFFYDSQL